MLTLIFALLAALIVGCAVYFAGGLTLVWSVILGALSMMAVQIVITLLLRRKITSLNNYIQGIMTETQQKLMAKQNHFMRRPTNQKAMIAELEREQRSGIQRALEACDAFRPLSKWNFLLTKQINTMRMIFQFQLKNYAEVDQLLPKCLLIDSQSLCIKMVRMYQTHATPEEIDKFFKKKCSRLKSDQAVLPYSLYTWILLKQDRNDDAFKTITEAKAKTSNEVILHNWEHLANGKFKQFSNSGLADSWYALALEEPKMQRVQQQYRYR